jgi:hypothetical protein
MIVNHDGGGFFDLLIAILEGEMKLLGKSEGEDREDINGGVKG